MDRMPYFLPNLMEEPVVLYQAAKKKRPAKKEKRSKPGREKKKAPKPKKKPDNTVIWEKK